MSEEEKKVEEPTEVITRKDPKRVEQGRKLAMISKEAKERKMRAKIEEEHESKRSRFEKLPTYIALGSSSLLAITLFFLWRKEPPIVLPAHPETLDRKEEHTNKKRVTFKTL